MATLPQGLRRVLNQRMAVFRREVLHHAPTADDCDRLRSAADAKRGEPPFADAEKRAEVAPKRGQADMGWRMRAG